MGEEKKSNSEVQDYIMKRVAGLLGMKKSFERFKRSFDNEDNARALSLFLDDSDEVGHLLFLPAGGEGVNLLTTLPPPSNFKQRKGVFMYKTERGVAIDPERVKELLAFMEMSGTVLESMSLLCQEVFLPVLANPENQKGWSDLVSKELIENKFHQFLSIIYVTIGEVKGRTMLPVPPQETTTSDRITSKDKAHVLEGAVITWTKQIKNVLKQDPETALKQGQNPNPLVEIAFWKNKAENLNSIHDQLQSEKISKVLKFLEQNKSTYTNQFAKLKKEVKAARMEANDNYKYLSTLSGLFYDLTDDTKDFPELQELFVPIMHTLLLIWQHSEYYNTPARLVVIVREICNAIISQARNFVSGKDIFDMIENEESSVACEKLSVILDIIAKFKEAFFEYKAQAGDSWNITTNALFVRLDSFSERCQDIQHFTSTIVQFSKLNKIQIGGTKGKTLTSSVMQIFDEFEQAVKDFQLVEYDIMDVGAKEFDDDFYEFRCKIKELERRLASILTQGFDDSDTIYGQFKLLDSFEGLLNRPIIQDELEKKHITLLETYKQDLKLVQQIFLENKPLVDELDSKAPIPKNMPPVTGAINWTRGLMERIKEPMEKLSTFNDAIFEREEYKDVQKLYKSLMKSLTEYQNSKIEVWESEVEESGREKLKQPLLAREEETGLLKVNFDPALVKLLREVKHFLLINMPVPESAQEIYAKNEVYRTQVANLDLIVFMYNEVKQTLHPVEKPLLQERIEKMDQTLEPGLKDLKWRSPNINEFIQASMIVVQDVNKTVKTMQSNLNGIKDIMKKWAEEPLIKRKAKPMNPDDFDQASKASIVNKLNDIDKGGKEINKFIKDIGECVKNAKKSPEWGIYQDFVNGLVIEGLVNVIKKSLLQLSDYFDPVYIKKNDMLPMFDVRIELADTRVIYTPEIQSNMSRSGLRDLVHGWIADFVKISTLIGRLDLIPGDYIIEVNDDFEFRFCLSKVENHLDWIEQQTEKFKSEFMEFSYLWEKDLNETFEEFLVQGENEKKKEGEDEEEEQQRLEKLQSHPIFEGVSIKMPELGNFDGEVTKLKNVKSKIEGMQSPHDIAWLRINVEPLKVALNTRVQNWISVYTGFLLRNVNGSLNNLSKFIETVSKGIELEDEEDIPQEALMKVMSHVRDVRTITEICDNMFLPLRDKVTLLKKHGVQMNEDLITKIEDMKTKWQDLKLKVNNVKAIILPHQTEETKKIKSKLWDFDRKVDEYRKGFLGQCPFNFGELTDEVINESYEAIDRLLVGLIEIESEARANNELNELFELEKNNYRPLKECRQELQFLKVLWDAISLVHNQYSDWKTTLWDKIDTEDLLEQNKNLQNMVKVLPKEIRTWKGYATLQDTVKNMATILPLINDLHSPNMEPRHWRQLMQITHKQINHTSPTFSLDDLLHLKLHEHADDVNEIVAQAGKEANIEKKLNAIEAAWAVAELAFEIHKDCPVILPLDEVVEMYETHSMELMSMQSSGKSIEYFRDRVNHWLGTLKAVEATLDVWLKVQRNWKRLETIFLASEDIRSQLPDQTKAFEGIDNEFRDIMNDAKENPLIVEATTVEGRKESLDTINQEIEVCENALNEYLAQKKKQFPRFYFISNQALLDILSNGNNPHRVCEYLGDLFNGMRGVEFESGPTGNKLNTTIGMYSKEESEYVPFPQKVNGGKFACEGAVESWLSSFEEMMRKVLKAILEEGRQTAELWDIQGEKPREIWIDDYPAQLAIVGTQIVWTEEVTRTIEEVFVGSESAMKDYAKVCVDRINKLIDRVMQPGISSDLRCKIISLITIDVHSRDVVEKFAVTKVSDVADFAWQSQLKFEWRGIASETDPNKDCHISICDWKDYYSYEYVGNCGRLVITPLTDRCYITLTQALNLIMGGAPAGPAGTGKTETVKDLGRAIGLPVMVFNCSPQMNKESMARIFLGLAQTGAWGCFDEFNRISIEVLSVVSTQVKTILDAQRAGKERFIFEAEENILLKHTVGFFITMNPGYAGRTELPENIKALFRSCAMVVPDTKLICENMLMSEGFKRARVLSDKFVTLYGLSKELLSKQKHYDWGLRAVKSVLRMAGKLRRADTDMDEDPVLMRALRDFNLPKIVTDDKPIFLTLIRDLFPGLNPKAKTNPDLYKKVEAVTKRAKLQAEETFVGKCIQLSEIMEVRHSVFVIGPPGCGKTEVWKMLAAVDGAETAYETINPKAVEAHELFGYLTKTKEWKDGVLSVVMRDMYKNQPPYKPTQKNKWIILDGDIDPDWIESLNTVMDDNKVLTLVSNERIPLTSAMRLIFEISNLRNATPATVSRAGVLYINETDIGTKPYMDSWLETVDDDIAKSHFMLNYQQLFEGEENNIEEIRRFTPVVPRVDISIVQSICCMLSSLMKSKEFLEVAKNLKEEDKKTIFEAYFMYAGVWAIGGAIADETVAKQFNTWWRSKFKKFPEAGTVYDYYFDPKKLTWEPWADLVTEYVPIAEQTVSSIIVPTVDIIRIKAVIELHVQGRRGTMFVGGSGTGKTTIAKDYLSCLNSEEVQNSAINFNNYTDSMALQRFIESNVEKRMGREYGPPANKQLIFFIDDLNMPYVDTYGTQSPIALLIQLMNYYQMFDRDHLEEQKKLKDIQFMACMNPKAGSFTVDPRLQRHFTTFGTMLPSQEILVHIYSSILGGHLNQFDTKISKLKDKVIDATLELFKLISANPEFAPSAKKFHYQFNLRDISRIIGGVMQSQPGLYRGAVDNFVKLWMHECDRTFLDRLIADKDVEVYKEYLNRCCKKFEDEASQEIYAEPNIFTSFVSAHGGDPAYLPIKDMAQLKRVLLDKLDEYNESNAQMNLVLFDIAMEHVCRVARILDMPGGNALLVGVGGSGKQSLSRLAAFILGYDVISILVSDKYTMNDFRTDIQEMYKKAGVKAGGSPCVFLLTDTQIQDERFLIYINDILSSGYIQDLFDRDELDGIFNSLRNEAKGAGVLVDSPEAMLEYFIDKARKNLHIVLCFSPVGETFRRRARKFPGIISCTLVDWFHPWPREALIDVGYQFLQEIEVETDEIRSSMANYMADVHVSVNEANAYFLQRERRYNYTTPKSFLELIDFFKKLIGQKRAGLEQAIERLSQGLDILAQTKDKVENLKQDLDVKMVEVKEEQEYVGQVVEEVTAAKEVADKEMADAAEEEAVAAELTEAANKLKAEAEAELSEAQPAMERAKKAVDCLTLKSLQELKALPKPPQGVDSVAKAVMLLRGERKNFAWQAAQKMLNQPAKFKEEIENFNKEQIDEWILEQLRPIIAQDFFNEKEMGKKSEAASFLCAWVVNVVEYNRIYKNVKPLMERKETAEKEAADKEEELSGARAKVKAATDHVETLQQKLNDAQVKKEKVESEAEEYQTKLALAEKLVGSLGDENTRWSENVAQYKKEMVTVLGDALLASSFVSYIGPFSASLRLKLWSETWLPNIVERKIAYTEGVDPLKVLCTGADEARWKNFGLPADRMSVENASMITSCKRWPLIIDPQLQGSKWIRGMHGEELEIIQFSQDRWIKRLENAITMGKIVMFESIGQEIDAILEPLLSQAIIKKGRNTMLIKLGSEEIEYNPSFKLYLQTKLYNPHYRPEIAAQCTIVNFIVTESGLEDQLLATVVNIEKPELEEDKQKLVKEQNEYKVILADLEEQLLNNLSAADPSTILDNTELIEGLEKTKQTSSEIQEKTAKAQETEKNINEAREVYRRVAAEGAMLYFLIISLCNINHMYQYSLESFLTFFLKAIEKTETFEEVEERVLNLKANIRMTIFTWVSRGLFEKHKQIFLTQITLRLMQKGDLETPYDPQMANFLLKCPLKPNVEKPQSLDWLPETAWSAVQRLIEIEEFQNFATSMEKDAPTRFKEWFNDLAPENAKLPLDWKRLDNTPFQKLLVLRCLRPDRLTSAVNQWIRVELPKGDDYVDIDQGYSFGEILEFVLEDATNTTPIFFILSPGTNPVADVEVSGKKRGIEENKNYWNVAMGEGQEQLAMNCLEMGHKEGHWVILENIHLMPKWLLQLEKKLDVFASEGSNMNFRLFLSAEPSPDIPIGILDRSIKLTNEPPQGMKANLKRAMAQFNKEEFNERDPRVRSIIFGLCFFHATVLERRKFGPKGWNMLYPFSMGDLRDSSLVLNNYFENNQGSSKIPWEDLRYIFGEIMYGGHIVDDWDRRLCKTYLTNLMQDLLLDEFELFPFSDGRAGASFKSPAPTEHQKYVEYIDEAFPYETPLAFGLHSNAEIGFLTSQGQFLFSTLLELQPRDESAAEDSAAKTKNEIAQEIVSHIQEELNLENLKFDLDEIKSRVPEEDEKMSFINVFLQECEYMNYLLVEMDKSLKEINLALNGELTTTDKMEKTIDSLVLEKVPSTWTELAWPSCRGLSSWLVNLQARVEQLSKWKDEPTTVPKVTNIARLFNPQSFLNAVKQFHAQKTQSELNKLYIQTDITKRYENEIEDPPREGAFVTGLNLDGARWDVTNSMVEDSKPKEMFCPLPVVNCKAVLVQEGKEEKNIYHCPAYKTENRGNTYVFTAQLRTPKHPPAKWILAGVAIVMDVEGIGDPVKK